MTKSEEVKSDKKSQKEAEKSVSKGPKLHTKMEKSTKNIYTKK